MTDGMEKKEIKKEEHDFVCVTSQHPICSHHTLTWLGKQELNFETVYFRKTSLLFLNPYGTESVP